MSISQNRRRAILGAHGGVCHYCGCIDAVHVDHIVPRADGGSDDLGNLIAACLPCNLFKRRHRLPSDAEARTLARAADLRGTVLEIESGMSQPRRARCEAPKDGFTPDLCRAGRAWVGWQLRELSDRSGVSAQSISRFESGQGIKPSAVAAIQAALEMGGVAFLIDPERPGVRRQPAA